MTNSYGPRTPHVVTRHDVDDDRGMEMLAKVLGFCIAVVVVLTLVMLSVSAWDREAAHGYTRPDVESRVEALTR